MFSCVALPFFLSFLEGGFKVKFAVFCLKGVCLGLMLMGLLLVLSLCLLVCLKQVVMGFCSIIFLFFSRLCFVCFCFLLCVGFPPDDVKIVTTSYLGNFTFGITAFTECVHVSSAIDR